MSEPCTRKPGCTKPRGHSGWCNNRKSEEAEPDESAPASSRERRASRSSAASSRIAGMQDLAARRDEQAAARSEGRGARRRGSGGAESAASGDVEYEDFGLSIAQRRGVRRGAPVPKVRDDSDDESEEERSCEEGAGVPAVHATLERLRLPRARLEQWHADPYFERRVLGCLVRITLDQAGHKLYRTAEVVGVQEGVREYLLGGQRTSKQLSLDFGESTHMYPMSNVSNGQFEQSELVAWEQVLVAASRELVAESRARVRAAKLERDVAAAEQSAQQNVHEPGPAAVDPRANAPPAQLSTRQRMAASATAEVARPHKFQRNVLGQAIVQQSDQ